MRVILHSKSQIVADVPGFVRESRDAATLTSNYNFSLESSNADADLTAEQAGRLCYLSGHRPNLKTAVNDRYLLNICAQKHYSVLGHASASFYIETSRNCTHEIIRHRWFTFSEVSQRYVDASDFELERHPGLQEAFLEELFEKGFIDAKAKYRLAAERLASLGSGNKQARQASRGILPGGIQTKILMSGNVRAWRDFLAQRLAPGADLEIRGVAREIYKILKREFPNSLQDFDIHGMITTERLISRALDRHDQALHLSGESAIKISRNFVSDVRDISEKGLWVLADDPWEEDEA